MELTIRHLTRDELEAGLDTARSSPLDHGVLELIVRRPAVNAREVLDVGRLDLALGLVGDTWPVRGSSRTDDGTPHPDMQLNIVNSRVIQLIAQHRDRWALAGDQLYVDIDISDANMPAGTRLAMGSAIVEVTPEPHTGCAKFVERFGVDAMKFVNSPQGRKMRLRGLNAKVVQPGTIRAGDRISKVPAGGD